MLRNGKAHRTHTGTVQRAHARARVWRRRLSRNERRRLLRQLRRPEFVSRHATGGIPIAVTHTDADTRYADFVYDEPRARLIAVVERPGERNPKIVSSPWISGRVQRHRSASWSRLLRGAAHSPDGRRLCFLSWDHPNMPWDGTQLHVGRCREDGRSRTTTIVAGGAAESIVSTRMADAGSPPVCVGSERLLEPLQLRRRAESIACIRTTPNTRARVEFRREILRVLGPATSSPNESTTARRASDHRCRSRHRNAAPKRLARLRSARRCSTTASTSSAAAPIVSPRSCRWI